MSGKALICGGSIAGLFAAAALSKIGWEVAIFERSAVELAGRGAGIVTHPALIDALHQIDASTDALGVAIDERVAYDPDGERLFACSYPQVVTSWDRMYQILRACVPDHIHHLGHAVTDYRDTGDGVVLTFDNGTEMQGDILIGADGFRSFVRGRALPEITPTYSGYLVWRALIDETDMPEEAPDNLFHLFGFYLPAGAQVIGYPIAGPDNDLRPGRRRYNFVWYRQVSEDDLDDLLTDETGQLHSMGIAPPLVRPDVLARMRAEAEQEIPAPFAAMFARARQPFFTPIYDLLCPAMAFGRVALAGDAACLARPHVGMGITKAAQDALALARLLAALPITEALSAYSEERVPASAADYDRARELGQMMLTGTGTGQNRDGRSHPHMERIVRETAIMPG